MTGQAPRQSVKFIRLDHLRANPFNPRDGLFNPRDGLDDLDGLTASIREHGVIEPLIVTEAPAEFDVYLIIAGHRRAEAARRAGLTAVPCVIRHEVDDVDDQVVLMLVENLQRTDLGPVEKAEAFGALQRRGYTVAAIASRVGLSESQVRKSLALLDLAPQSLEAVRDGRIPVGHALDAVKDARAAVRREPYRRPTDGPVACRAPRVPTVVEPAHFAGSHPLADEWARRCHHTTRPRIAGACGQCIEAVIRADERLAIASTDPVDQPIRSTA